MLISTTAAYLLMAAKVGDSAASGARRRERCAPPSRRFHASRASPAFIPANLGRSRRRASRRSSQWCGGAASAGARLTPARLVLGWSMARSRACSASSIAPPSRRTVEASGRSTFQTPPCVRLGVSEAGGFPLPSASCSDPGRLLPRGDLGARVGPPDHTGPIAAQARTRWMESSAGRCRANGMPRWRRSIPPIR